MKRIRLSLRLVAIALAVAAGVAQAQGASIESWQAGTLEVGVDSDTTGLSWSATAAAQAAGELGPSLRSAGFIPKSPAPLSIRVRFSEGKTADTFELRGDSPLAGIPFQGCALRARVEATLGGRVLAAKDIEGATPGNFEATLAATRWESSQKAREAVQRAATDRFRDSWRAMQLEAAILDALAGGRQLAEDAVKKRYGCESVRLLDLEAFGADWWHLADPAQVATCTVPAPACVRLGTGKGVKIPLPEGALAGHAAVDAEGRRVAYAFERIRRDAQVVQVFDVDNGKAVTQAEVPMRSVSGQQFLGNDALFVHGNSEVGPILVRVALDTGAIARIELPADSGAEGVRVLHVLADGRLALLVTQGESAIGVWDPASRRWSWKSACRDAQDWIFTRTAGDRLRVLVRGELTERALGTGETLLQQPARGVTGRFRPGLVHLGADPMAVLDGVTLTVFAQPRDRSLPLVLSSAAVYAPGKLTGLAPWGATLTWAIDSLPEK